MRDIQKKNAYMSEYNKRSDIIKRYQDRWTQNYSDPEWKRAHLAKKHTEYANNREKFIEYAKKYRTTTRYTDLDLKRKYGIGLKEVEKMLENQHNECAICKVKLLMKGWSRNSMTVDHNHATGAVRGLLCRNCNMAIGSLGDNADRIRAALEYIEKF